MTESITKVLLLILLCLPVILTAQVEFTIDQNFNQLNATLLDDSPNPTSFADVNGDGWDDLTYLDSLGHIKSTWFDQNLKTIIISGDSTNNNVCYNFVVGDLNNDGVNEILTSGEYNGAKLYQHDASKDSLQLIQLSNNDFFAQGANLVDIDIDGYLDLFVCNDDSLSKVFLNNQNGLLADSSAFIDMRTAIESDNSGNYASEWTDYDLDGDLDLYIAKCRIGATDFDDPRRINVLYENLGADGFKEVAQDKGLATGAQTWTANFADLDNDGDMDLFLANHSVPHEIYENTGNEIFVKTDLLNGLKSFAIHSIIRDFDNNGFDDIFITGDRSYFLYNFGDFNFEIIEDPFDGYAIRHFSTGDYNRDGFLDLFATGLLLKSNAPFFSEYLFANQTNNNNWVAFHLIGTDSNRNGIGSTLELYGAWGKQTKQLKAGESYGMMNSLNIHFGVGQEDKIDSLKVTWPSGQIDVYPDINLNQYHQVTEGLCIKSARNFDPFLSRFCEGGTLELSSNAVNLDTEWSNGSLSNFTSADTTQNLYYRNIDSSGCTSISNSILFQENPLDQIAKIKPLLRDTFCSGEEVTLQAINLNEDSGYQWNTQETNAIIQVSASGIYKLRQRGSCGTTVDSISIHFIPDNIISIQEDSVKMDSTARLIANSSDSLHWFESIESDSIIAKGDSLIIENVQKQDTFYVQTFNSFKNKYHSVGQKEIKGTNSFAETTVNSGLLFEVYQDMLLDSITVYTEEAGPRTIWILSETNEIIFQQKFDLDSGKYVLPIEKEILTGDNYKISTDASANLLNYGSLSPRLGTSNDQVKYPYRIDDLIEIKNSTAGNSIFPYFFDWKVSLSNSECRSNRVPVILFFNDGVATSDFEISGVKLAPNPTKDILNISSEIYKISKVEIIDAIGRPQLIEEMNGGKQIQLNLSSLKSGVYFVKLNFKNNSEQIIKKIILSK